MTNLPNNDRIRIQEEPDKLIIHTKPKRKKHFNFQLGSTLFGTSVFSIAILFILPYIINKSTVAGLFWGGGIFILTTFTIYGYKWLFWLAWGSELLIIDKNGLRIEKKMAVGHPTKNFSFDEIKNFRIAQKPYSERAYLTFIDNTVAIETGGRIMFDYGMKTIRFAQLIENEEAKQILSLVKEEIKKQSTKTQNIVKAQKPYKGHARISEKKEQLKIKINGKRNWFLIFAFFGAEIAFFGMLSGYVITELGKVSGISDFSRDSIIIVLILALVNLFIVSNILSGLFRKEIIAFDKTKLKIRKPFSLHRARKFQLNKISEFNVREKLVYKGLVGGSVNRRRTISIWTIVLAEVFNFSYEGECVRFGNGIDEAEAKHIMQTLVDKGYLPGN